MTLPNFAIFGSKPEFEMALPVGQLYFPSWTRYERAFRGIFDRQYYNNNGPLLGELETKLQAFLGVKHAICVSNATLGLIMTAEAMELSGKVILPAFTFAASAQSLDWANLSPIFCDVDPTTHQIDLSLIEPLVDRGVSAIMGVNLWGGACPLADLQNLAASLDIKLYFDSAHAFGCEVNGVKVGGFGSAEVFSFHATKILNATEGGCICTNDDQLADRLRNIRPSYGKYNQVSVVKVANARMSEAQAAVALMSLEDFPMNRANNQALHGLYSSLLKDVPGLQIIHPNGVTLSNFQYMACRIDEDAFGMSRDFLISLLHAENIIARRYFYPGLHRNLPYSQTHPAYKDSLPQTDALCESCLQLPIGALVGAPEVERICNVLVRAQKAAPEISRRM